MGVKATKDMEIMEQQLPWHVSKQMGVKQPHMGKTVVLTTKHAKDRLSVAPNGSGSPRNQQRIGTYCLHP